jgi:hypothetical protein
VNFECKGQAIFLYLKNFLIGGTGFPACAEEAD